MIPKDTSLLSWYDISLKLHLSEIMKNATRETVLENMAGALMEESSVRLRKPLEVIVKGLATLPTVKPNSSMRTMEPEVNETKDFTPIEENLSPNFSEPVRNSRSKSKKEFRKTPLCFSEPTLLKTSRTRIIRRSKDSTIDFGKPKPSAENWIPEVTRMRSLHRDLAVAKENLLDIEVRETERSREMRRFCLSELEHAHAEESLGRKKKKRCGCCLQLFSYVNLPLSVSHKAIIDIRKSWVSAHASNSSMNEKSPSKTRTNGDGSRQTISNAWIDEDERLSVVPRCYDEVRVCTFCAQFFHALEKYRPSFDMVAHEAKRKAALEREKREKEYWDPLKMCEKDRQEAEALEKQAAAAAAAMANSGASVT